MSLRRKPAQNNDVINFKDGFMTTESKEPLSMLKEEISQLRSKLEEQSEVRTDRKMGDSAKMHHSYHHTKSEAPRSHHRAQVMEKLEKLERQVNTAQISDQLTRLESKLSNPSRDVMQKLDTLESRLQSTPETVLKKLDHIESRLSSDMSKLTCLESRLASPQEQVMSKLTALENKMSNDDHQFNSALSRLNALHEEMTAQSDAGDLRNIKESVHSKLLELERRVGTPCSVTADDWLQERKRLSKLQSMRVKIANA